MRWGLVARAEDRGLAHICWEVYRHLLPTRTLVVDMGPLARGFLPDWERYPNADTIRYDETCPTGGPLNDSAMREWLAGLDVVYSAETFYDTRFVRIAREMGVRTVLHTMPEFHKPECDEVDVVWLPTPWRAEHHPDALLVPVPVALDRFEPEHLAAEAHTPGPLRVLHTAGHRAAMDRNGTLLVCEAMRHVRQPVHLTIRTQDADCPNPSGHTPNVTVDVVYAATGDYWEQYARQHALVLPRRYGGLCLPVQEAMGAGCAVVMGGVSPNEWWPTVRVGGGRGAALQAPGGELTTFNTNPELLAVAIDQLAANRVDLGTWQERARLWSHDHSWDRLTPLWLAALEDACS